MYFSIGKLDFQVSFLLACHFIPGIKVVCRGHFCALTSTIKDPVFVLVRGNQWTYAKIPIFEEILKICKNIQNFLPGDEPRPVDWKTALFATRPQELMEIVNASKTGLLDIPKFNTSLESQGVL